MPLQTRRPRGQYIDPKLADKAELVAAEAVFRAAAFWRSPPSRASEASAFRPRKFRSSGSTWLVATASSERKSPRSRLSPGGAGDFERRAPRELEDEAFFGASGSNG